MPDWKPPAPSVRVRHAFAQWRAALDSARGRRVAVFFPDRETMAGAMLAAWASGREVVLPGDVLPKTLQALAPLADVWLGAFPGALEAVAATPPQTLPAIDLSSRLTVFTSGSTGVPVAQPRSLSQLLLETNALEQAFGAALPAGAHVFSTVSHQHLYGLLFTVLWPLSTGRTLTPHRLEFPQQLREALAPVDSVLVTSPAFLKRLPEGEPVKGRLHGVFSSGGMLSPDDSRRAEVLLGKTPLDVYGSSETGGIAWRTVRSPRWALLPGVECRVSDAGLLEVRSPFFGTADWFRLSDRAELEAGSFVLLGRADRIVKLEEQRISLDAIERGLVESGWCVEARAVVLQGARLEMGAVCRLSEAGTVLAKKGHRAVSQALRTALEDRIPRVGLPRRFRFVTELPKNTQGKVTFELLEALFVSRPPAT